MADRVVETAPGTMIVSYHAVLSSVRFSWTPRLKKYEQALTLLSPYSVALLLAVYSFIFWYGQSMSFLLQNFIIL